MNRNCGIYKITSPTGRVYIGQAIDIEKRRRGYFKPTGANRQPRLKNSFLKHGIENHQFDIIEYCSEEELNCSERFWQDEFDATNKENLNCMLQNCGEKRKVYTEEIKKKISESRLGEKNPNWGKKMSQESIEKRNASRKCTKGKIISEETKQKMKDNHYDASGGNNSRAKKVINTKTKEVFSCILDAAKSIGMDRRKLNDWLNNHHRNKTTLKYLENV